MAYEQRLGSTHKWRLLRKRAIAELPLICSNPACRRSLDLMARRGSVNAAELDHIIPRRAGGEDVMENVQWMCASCNRRKSDRTDNDPSPSGLWCCRHGRQVLSTCPCPEVPWSATY